jgi:hypothetical protein
MGRKSSFGSCLIPGPTNGVSLMNPARCGQSDCALSVKSRHRSSASPSARTRTEGAAKLPEITMRGSGPGSWLSRSVSLSNERVCIPSGVGDHRQRSCDGCASSSKAPLVRDCRTAHRIPNGAAGTPGWRHEEGRDVEICSGIDRMGCSDLLRYQVDGAAGAFLYAESTALAVVIVKAIAVTICNLTDRVVRADAEAVVALEAIPA